MNDLVVKRTLAAIVMADVVGYSRLMGDDDAGTLKRLTQYRAEFIDTTIADHRGRIVNAIGDSLLLEFASVVDATLCAITLQQELVARNAGLEEAKRIAFRMGVNIGDVIVQDRALFGDGVNVAARLQTLAEPGGICISSAAFEQIRGKIEADFADRGAYNVKNITRPIEVFALSPLTIEGLPRRAPPKTAKLRRNALIGAAAFCILAALGYGVAYLAKLEARRELAAHLDAILIATQGKLTTTAREKLIASYLAIGRHRAFAISPKAQGHWWTGDWLSAKVAQEKALERCQIAFGEPCVSIAVDDAMAPTKGEDARPTHEMARFGYAGEFDPEQIPAIRQIVAARADVLGYLQAPEPKAAALHPRGLLTIVTGAASTRRAQTQALKLCNEDDSTKDADGPCYLYAVGNEVVLPKRLTAAITP